MTMVDNKFLYQFVNKRSLDSKPATVKHNLGVITRVIKLCKKLGYDVSVVEAPSVKIKNTKIRVLTKDEETKLLDSFLSVQGRGFTPSVKHDLKEWHDITVCLLGTGCRINEILELKWNQVDMENRVFNIWRKKTSSASILPMSDKVFEVLSQRKQVSIYVFPNDELTAPRRYSSNVFKKACDRAGIEEVTWHNQYLNMCSRDYWTQPIADKGEPHWMFDILLQSVSGGKQEARDHIEQCITYKYLHPEEVRIPCVCIAGEGAVGKNILVDDVLTTLLGENMVITVSDSVFGQFNGEMLGKAVVFIDESNIDKNDQDKLKKWVWNKTIDINGKYGVKGSFENTIWFITGSNEPTGAIQITGTSVDRRYSVIRVKLNIMNYVAQMHNTYYDQNKLSSDENKETVDIFMQNKSVYTNSEQVAIWINSLIVKWGHLSSPPEALHGEDYDNLVEVQKSPFVETMEYVFYDHNFEYITYADLYIVYQLTIKEINPSGVKFTVGRNKFLEQTRGWLEKYRLEVDDRSNKTDGGHISVKSKVGKRTSQNSFVQSTLRAITSFDENTHKYIIFNEYGVPVGVVGRLEIEPECFDFNDSKKVLLKSSMRT